MPTRTTNTGEDRNSLARHKKYVDLTFLPEEYLAQVNDIFDRYFSLGMSRKIPSIPEGEPSFPNKFSTLTSQEVGDQLAEATGWLSFTIGKLKYISVACSVIQNEMDKIVNGELSTAKGGNLDQRKAMAKSNTAYLSVLQYKVKLDGIKIMLDNEYNSFDRKVAAISREISRRESNAGY